jgi:hypothetical protein
MYQDILSDWIDYEFAFFKFIFKISHNYNFVNKYFQELPED